MLPGLLKHLSVQREHLQILPGPTLLKQRLLPCLPEASPPAFLPEHWGGWDFSSHVAGGMCLQSHSAL